MIALALLAAATPCAGATNQVALRACTAADERNADAAMTRAWRAAYARMKARDAADHSRGGGPGYAAALLASQRAWLKYRDAQCIIAGLEFAGGTMQPVARLRCLATQAEARARDLATIGEPDR